MYDALLTIGTLSVTPFSVAVFIGALLGSFLLLWLAKKTSLNEQALLLLVLSLGTGIILGHALFAMTRVLIYPLDYEHPISFILNPSVGGFMYLGVFGGGALAALLVSTIKKVSFSNLMSILLPALFLTLALVRFAEPLDLQGKGPVIDGFLFPFSYAPESEYPDDRYIPVFFYEGLYALVIMIWSTLNTLGKTGKPRTGRFFFILYLAGQMFFEVFRQDEYINATSLITFIRLNQLFAAILLGIFLIHFAIKAKNNIASNALTLRCAVFIISVGACIGLQFLFDKPLPFFGQTVWFPDWLVYCLLALSALGMGWPCVSLLSKTQSAVAETV